MLLQTLLPALVASPAFAFPGKLPLPPRYHNDLRGATFLDSFENGGVSPPPFNFQQVFIQAIDGRLVFTRDPPTRICPCSDSFGAQNFTGYYVGGTNEKPTLQLFTSSPGAQYVYIAPDLSVRYTLPGAPIPPGGNATSFRLFNPEPLGSGLPSTSVADIKGHVTSFDGTKTYYKGVQFCADEDSPPGTENGAGPLKIVAQRTEGNMPDGSGITDAHCRFGYIESSVDAPKVAPYDITFRTPSEPLAFAYSNF